MLFADADANGTSGRWHFSLESLDGSKKVMATDDESDQSSSRLELLAVIRGLEALDQPSRVTLMTTSAYVRRGIRFGVHEWRNSDWRWERFGLMVPITNADLWQRLERAMQFHEVKCRGWRLPRVDNGHVLRGPHRRRRSVGSASLSRETQKQAS
jgi:ribonuclease HI